jgi:hypothetical protein
MLDDLDSKTNNPALEIGAEESNHHDVADYDFTAEALAALAEVDVHGTNEMPPAMRFGKTVSNAKKLLPHGEYTPWCENTLKRKPTWCASYKRLYECGGDLDAARAWAKENQHRWADCYSVERLLKLVGDWRNRNPGDSPSAPKARQKPSQGIVERRQRLEQAEAELVRVRDLLPLVLEGDARVMELVGLAADNDETAIKQLVELAQRYHWCLRDLIERETDGAPQVSEPTLEGSAHPRPGAAETDARMDEAGHPRDQGNTGDSSGVGAAPTTDLNNPETAEVLDEASPGGGDDVHEIRPENSLANNRRPSGTRGSGIVFPNTVMRNSVRVPVVPQIGARE